MHRGEIWLINLDPTVGVELRKTRPAVIVNDDSIGILPLKVIVPITEWKENYTKAPWMVRLTPDDHNGISKPSAADAFQVRSLSQERFVRKIGQLSDSEMREITEALAAVLNIDFENYDLTLP